MPSEVSVQQKEIFIDKAASLSRIFSNSVIGDLALKGNSATMKRVFKEIQVDRLFDEESTLRECFDYFYKLIFKYYRNEYVYKNSIARKVLLGRHSVKTSCMLTEFRISNSKADVLVLNGTSHVYEIKTDLDSLDRLPKQVSDYKRAVDYVNVITSPSYADKVENCVDDDVGILVLNNRGSISTLRSPSSNKKNVNPGVIFDSLRKNEYLSIIKSCGVEIPDVPNTLLFKQCRDIFSSFDPVLCHDRMLESVKKRTLDKDLENFVLSLPDSLKSIAYSSGLSKASKKHFLEVLDKRVVDLV
jgi:hypothetical protein